LVYDIVTSKKEVLNFIKFFSSKEIEPYNVAKIITLKDYLEKYKDLHIKISHYYFNCLHNSYIFEYFFEKMKLLIEQEIEDNKLLNKDKDKVLKRFLTFRYAKDLDGCIDNIVEGCADYSIYLDLNKWLMNPNFNSFEVVAYFAAILMYSLNKYAKENKEYYDFNQTIFGGYKLHYSDILLYERAKGKIIALSSFIDTFEVIKVAELFADRENANQYHFSNKFSVIFYIKNNFKKGWISNGIRVSKISVCPSEKKVIYQPFSFYYVKDVKIDLENYKADIYLETIGKKEILEEKIKLGKEIKYNEKEKIMEVK